MFLGMSWALINMVPYLIVVIYCWYRVRIPGLVCACFRNIQLLLRAVCGVLILIQAYTTRNLTEKFICPHDYIAKIGKSPLTMVRMLTLNFTTIYHVVNRVKSGRPGRDFKFNLGPDFRRCKWN